MVMTIDIPENAVKEAEARGIPVEDLLREKFAAAPDSPTTKSEARGRVLAGLTPFGPGTKTPAEAAASMREMRKRYTLGGTVTIKQLIEEGRRY